MTHRYPVTQALPRVTQDPQVDRALPRYPAYITRGTGRAYLNPRSEGNEEV